ncbi:VCBS repeat-containing protein [Desulfopila sp. IMCC35006]|uniref:FG-GAP repeat domain-containing protein n=1 Tax=Desulfopila sp. IMCC35006 TaxID=2569542 RepID=UPI00142EB3A7|nr:VCBS repeat-containing protein [Desulfopila sp. IMCC35006]
MDAIIKKLGECMQAKIIVVSLVYFCLTLVHVGAASAEEATAKPESTRQYQIVFSTFDKNSAGKYAYLRDSVQAMLAGRLAAKDRVRVMEKTFSEGELASLKKKGTDKNLSFGGVNADYLVTGALFALTSGLEIQVELYPLVPKEEILNFSVRSPTPDTLIADIDKLSEEISQTAFGYRAAVPGKEAKTVDVEGNRGFVTVHPEEAYKRNQYSGAVIGVAGSGVVTKGRGAKITATEPVNMRAMALGDVNGDGQQEILLLAGQDLLLYGTRDNAIVQLAKTSLPGNLTVHAVNLADLDGDKKDEVYLSATDGLNVSSTIMKYDPTGGFQTISRNIPWYLRPVMIPGKGWQLAGQKRGMERLNLLSPGVYLLSLDTKYNITNQARIALPTSVNLFDFVYADLDGDGFYEIVAVDQREKLRVYNPGNELMWVSQKNFASSKIYLGPSRSGSSGKSVRGFFTLDEDADRELIFVPARIIVTDIDKDGKQEIIVSEGTKTGFSFFNRLRLYDSGAVVSLAWTNSAMVESWRTSNFRGYVAGYGFTLLDESQAREKQGTKNDTTAKTGVTAGRLFIGNLPKSGSLVDLIPGGSETDLSVYDLEFTHQKIKK